eukprot:13266532-Alexandrium_andersonii.AAC.1
MTSLDGLTTLPAEDRDAVRDAFTSATTLVASGAAAAPPADPVQAAREQGEILPLPAALQNLEWWDG